MFDFTGIIFSSIKAVLLMVDFNMELEFKNNYYILFSLKE